MNCPTCGQSTERLAITRVGTARLTPSALSLDGWGFSAAPMDEEPPTLGGWSPQEMAQIAVDRGTFLG